MPSWNSSKKLGDEIEKLWRSKNYNEDVFPTIASNALKAANIPSKITVWDVAKWALTINELPRQRDLKAGFGDPPITIYSGLRFHIDLYFWFEGTTSVHQHAFCGGVSSNTRLKHPQLVRIYARKSNKRFYAHRIDRSEEMRHTRGQSDPRDPCR